MTRAELEVIDARLAMEEEVRLLRYPTLLGLLHFHPDTRAQMAETAEGVAVQVEMMAEPDYEVRAATYRAIATDLRRDY